MFKGKIMAYGTHSELLHKKINFSELTAKPAEKEERLDMDTIAEIETDTDAESSDIDEPGILFQAESIKFDSVIETDPGKYSKLRKISGDTSTDGDGHLNSRISLNKIAARKVCFFSLG